MSREVDPLKAYGEACNTARHYSNASLAVRTVSVVQGIVLLGAWAVAFSQQSYLIEFLITIIGALFTVLLYRFHMGYFHAAEAFYSSAARMEEKLFDEDCRPFSAYNKKHEELSGQTHFSLPIIGYPLSSSSKKAMSRAAS